jgi:hypothetical protein
MTLHPGPHSPGFISGPRKEMCMKMIKTCFMVAMLAAVLLSACAPAASPQPAAAAPQAAAPTSTPTAAPPEPTATNPPPTPTARPSATLTPTPLPSPTATDPATPTSAVGTCYKAGLVAEMTKPDSDSMAVTQVFTKTWRLVNLGTCTWTPDFQVVYGASGYKPDTAGAFKLGTTVPPQNTVNISVTLTAPAYAGTFGGSYKLITPDGVLFGIGPAASDAFGYSVVVQNVDTPSPFAVTSVKMGINASSASVSCPPGKKFVITANIYTNGAGVVNYHWVFSDGGTSDQQTLVFEEEGSQSVSTSWALGTKKDVSPNPFSGWAQIYIDSPNHQALGRVSFSISCH